MMQATKRSTRVWFFAVPTFLMLGMALVVFGRHANVKPGDVAPNFNLMSFDAKPVKLSDFRGSPVFINFWASWCIPCIQEANDLRLTSERFKDSNLQMIGINSEDLREDADRYLSKFGLEYLNLRDTSGQVSKRMYGVSAYPESFFIDSRGKLVAHVFGPMTAGEMKSRIETLLAADAAGG